jgi:phosphoglycerate dehydrogenase-like enzyme
MNKPINTLITLPFPEDLIANLNDISPRLDITEFNTKNHGEIPDELWGKTEILYTNHVLPTAEQAPELRWIQFHWAGVDHILDDPILKVPELVTTTLSGASASQVAEYILMMLLALGHRLPDMIAHQNRGEWPSDRWDIYLPLELRDSTVGIVGYGSIGRQLARLLHSFGATVLATKRDAMHPEDRGYIPEGIGDQAGDFVHRIYPTAALNSMLEECDFVVVAVPKTVQTLNLISSEALNMMKPSSFLVDISRGGIIDHEALIPALKEQKIAGAALDVFPEEPLPSDSPLWELPNVIITPHISGSTSYYDERAIEMFAANLQRYLEGQPLYNQIDPIGGY